MLISWRATQYVLPTLQTWSKQSHGWILTAIFVSKEQEKYDVSINTDLNELSDNNESNPKLDRIAPGPPKDSSASWIHALLAFLVVFSTQGYFNSFGTYQAVYTTQLPDVPATQISWIGSIQVCLVNFLGVLAGHLADAGHFRAIFVTGMIFQLVGLFTASFAVTFWQIFISHGLCVGIGAGLIFAPTIAVLSSYFERHGSFAIALATCGGASGGTVFPALLRELIPLLGLSWSIRVAGFIVATFLTIAFAFLRPIQNSQKKVKAFPFRSLKDLHYILFAISAFLAFWPIYFGFYYISQYAKDFLHFNSDQTFNLVIIMNAAGIPARVIASLLADRFGIVKEIFMGGLALAAVIFYCWSRVLTHDGLYALCTAFGLVVGTLQTLFLAVSSSLAKDENTKGVRIGVLCTVTSFSSLTGAPLGGAIIHLDHEKYTPAVMWAGTSILVAFSVLIGGKVHEHILAKRCN
ncbi:hypothetical protein N7532_003716 [Penicillium argentinense]|uniref:Major facilitator superfamily (MFS) profile domain-containing protein n=1 Tax=Penicillium argentinense TaxID=1131581 RepID=A0A9W9KFG5_9EURO|nr:uncharacterized protein N7532_003716 [Penicillium argentinense]KAJ5103187.1 hypothetical protein N7532_003716 [Penicillium argentinense]